MSRIAKKGIHIPSGTLVTFNEGTVHVKGPHGELSRSFPKVVVENDLVTFNPRSSTLEGRAMLGTVAAHVRNMVKGVNEKYEKKLILEGIGYKIEVKGQNLAMALGFSHPVEVAIPSGITVSVEKNVITIQGIDKELVGQFAASLRSLKKPEPYKGKGMRYSDEVIERKQGKKSA